MRQLVVDVEDIVTPSEIAERAGVTRSCVSNWIARHPNFPPPIKERDGKLFLWSEVRWFRLLREARGEL